jgi:hypothetical protein
MRVGRSAYLRRITRYRNSPAKHDMTDRKATQRELLPLSGITGEAYCGADELPRSSLAIYNEHFSPRHSFREVNCPGAKIMTDPSCQSLSPQLFAVPDVPAFPGVSSLTRAPSLRSRVIKTTTFLPLRILARWPVLLAISELGPVESQLPL